MIELKKLIRDFLCTKTLDYNSFRKWNSINRQTRKHALMSSIRKFMSLNERSKKRLVKKSRKNVRDKQGKDADKRRMEDFSITLKALILRTFDI